MEINPVEQIEVQKALDLRKELEAIPYSDMKKEFTALGIGDSFTPGTKKETLVSIAIAALEKLDAIEALKAKGESVIEPISAEIIEEKAVILEEIVVKSDEIAVKSDEIAVKSDEKATIEPSELVKPIYSREVIMENLHNIGLVIPQSIDIHKIVLVEKQDKLVQMLKDLDAWEEAQA